MDFSTPFSINAPFEAVGRRVWLKIVGAVGFSAALGSLSIAQSEASWAEVLEAALRLDGDTSRFWVLDAEIRWFEPTAPWQGFLESGIPAPFRIDLRFWASRAWWFDQLIWAIVWRFELAYRPATGNWRLRHNEQVLEVGSYEACLARLSRIRSWRVVAEDRLQFDEALIAELTISIDESALAPQLRLLARDRPQILWQSRPFRWRLGR